MTAPGPAVRGADISFTLQLEEAGATWQQHGAVRSLEDLLRVLLDLHCSDFWADPGKQVVPAAWAGQDLAQLAGTVRRYTRDVLGRFSDAGAPVDMVQVGNEVTNGMLWPLGRIPGPAPEDVDDFVTLLAAGLAGVADARMSGAPPRTMVHVDRGGDLAGTRSFYDRVLDRGVRYDVIGQSYYPFWHGSLTDLETNLVDSAGRYDKDVVVVETSYPWTLDSADAEDDLISEPGQLPDLERWPPTPQAYFEALRGVFPRVPGGRGLGFIVWEPGWLPGSAASPARGTRTTTSPCSTGRAGRSRRSRRSARVRSAEHPTALQPHDVVGHREDPLVVRRDHCPR